MRRRRFTHWVALAAVVLPLVVTTTGAGASAALSGPLHTAGNQILDASGNPVHLRGLSRTGLEMSWTGGENLDDHEFDQARAWGANVVRVTLNEDYWNQQCPTSWYDPGYRY